MIPIIYKLESVLQRIMRTIFWKNTVVGLGIFSMWGSVLVYRKLMQSNIYIYENLLDIFVHSLIACDCRIVLFDWIV